MNTFDCSWFQPCPICKRCMNVADNLYERCQKCGFSEVRCKHTEDQRALMIRRSNFRLKVTDDVKDAIKNISRESLP